MFDHFLFELLTLGFTLRVYSGPVFGSGDAIASYIFEVFLVLSDLPVVDIHVNTSGGE